MVRAPAHNSGPSVPRVHPACPPARRCRKAHASMLAHQDCRIILGGRSFCEGLDLPLGIWTMLRLRPLILLGNAALFVLLGAATAAAAGDNFGAIAFSSSSGATGYSYDYDSRDGAEERALQECGPGCKVVLWFKNACGALAVGKAAATEPAGRQAGARPRTWRWAIVGKTPVAAKSAGGRARRGKPAP